MRDADLKNLLKQVRIPEARMEARERALDAARIALQYQKVAGPEEAPRRSFFAFRLNFAMGAALSAILIVPMAYYLFWNQQQQWQQMMMMEQQRLTKLEKVFPKRLKGVVTEDGETKILTSTQERKNPEKPIYLEIDQGGKKTKITTFSGETIELGGGTQGKLQVMMTGEGKVLVIGKGSKGGRFLWESEGQDSKDGKVKGQDDMKIRAQPLPLDL